MVERAVRNGVVRVQGDRLCEMIGISKGTKIPKQDIEAIDKADVMKTINVCGKQVIVTSSMKAIASILLGKGVIED